MKTKKHSQIDKLKNILCSNDIELSIANNLDTLIDIIPEIKDMFGFEQRHPMHHLDVWRHTLCALSYSKNDFQTRLVLLLHDIGKPHSFTEDDSIRHFKNHGKVSAIISKNILCRLGFDKTFIDETIELIRVHDDEITQEEIEKNLDFTIKKFEIQTCDGLAHNPINIEPIIKYNRKIKKQIDRKINELNKEPLNY